MVSFLLIYLEGVGKRQQGGCWDGFYIEKGLQAAWMSGN